MKKKLIGKNALVILCIILLLIGVVSPVAAWFANTNRLSHNTTGSSYLNYFSSGFGTEEKPYIIQYPRHLYNLAWLQDLGKLQDKKYYFELSQDIDMDGLAVPPIGTAAYPFIGHFEGKRYTISNLFVSNIKQELKTMFNTAQVDLGNQVGFFGRVDSNSTPYSLVTAGEAYNFYLENVNIANGAENSIIGIVAGFNNGTLKNIGVSNNSFKLTSGKSAESDFVLIGKTGADSEWIDSPNYFGNKILIDPNDPSDLFTALLPSGDPNQQYRTITGSVPEQAYMTPTLNLLQAGPKTLYKIRAVSSGIEQGVPTLTPSNSLAIYSQTAAVSEGIPAEFWTRYTSFSNTRYIEPANPPSPNVTVGVPYNGGTLQIPANGIWFKPKGDGTCGMAFSVYNQNAAAAMSVYKYSRDSSGAIINWTQTRFLLPKNAFSNKDIVYFDFHVDNGYEYIVSKDTLATNVAGFYYLTLSGVGYEGGGLENKSATQRIDYVMRETDNKFPDLSLQTYKPNRTHLSFAGTASSTGYMYFNKTNYNSNTAVYFYSAAGSLSITENVHIVALPQSAPAPAGNLGDIFYDWMSAYTGGS